jgi:phenylalanyl-tRNA synthetase beta subunit
MFVIARAIEGVTLNGKEYLLDKNNEVLKFGTQGTAVAFCEQMWDAGCEPDATYLKQMIGCIEEENQ